MTERIIPTTELNNCGGRCPLLIHIEDGIPKKVTGNPKYPDLKPCIKGLAAIDTFLSPDRLLYPMKRAGQRGEGKFTRISWEEALEEITDQWIRIRDTYGPASRYVHYGWGVSAAMSGLRAAKRLLALDGGYQGYYNSYSTACCAYTTPYLYGTTQSGSSYETLLDSSLIILWAHNPAETRFDHLMYVLKQAKEKGIPILVIDPRKNATVHALQAEWIPVRPGTDAALMDAMAYVIYTEDLYDHEFVNTYCQGFTEETMPPKTDRTECYFDYLIGKKDGIQKDPVWAEIITGVPRDTIYDLARRFAHAKPAALLQGYGGQRHTNGEQFTRGGIMLACLTGNVGIKGGWASGAGYCTQISEPELPSIENPVKERIAVYEWTKALEQGKLKMILNLAGNALINQHGDINYTKHLLKDEHNCEFILCSDIFMTPSAKCADILLPGVSMFEANNITSPWSQGNYLTCVNKIIEPLGECRQEYDWLLKIAENLGLSEAFSEGHMTVEEWLKTIYENHRCQYPQFPEYEEFQRLGIVRLLKEEGKVAFRDRHFPTPSGKVEIYSELLKSYGDPRIPAIPCYVPEKEGPGREKEYPLQLVGWHSITRTHSVHDNNPNLQKQPQRIWMHEQDARERSLKEGSLAEVFNKRGKMRLNVHLTREIMPGTVALSQGAWYQPDRDEVDLAGSINVLTTLEASPLAHGNGQHTCLVEIKKWEKTT